MLTGCKLRSGFEGTYMVDSDRNVEVRKSSEENVVKGKLATSKKYLQDVRIEN